LPASPPRDRPRVSRLRNSPVPRRRSGVLSTAGAAGPDPRQPGRIHAGRGAPRPGRVLVRPHHRGTGRDRPLRAFGLVAPGPQPVQDHLPSPVR